MTEEKWTKLRMRAFLGGDPELSTASALVNVAVDEWLARNPDPKPTVSPLRTGATVTQNAAPPEKLNVNDILRKVNRGRG